MQDYWETRVKTNGKYENTYTLGLRGIHDYPMEGANSTAERVALMQQAIDDQRDMLRRNIKKPIEEIPQVLCTYEEVLEAYHNGLKVPEDVTLLWSDDKHGYCRNLCNPDEMKRKGGAGIYYHLSYHGDPASWIWLSPLSTAFLSTELTKAYTFGARKIWVFNVGDIKPAEKEISFVMDLAWDVNRWKPSEAHNYIKYWATKTFGSEVAQEIADIQAGYYRLQAAGKDAHVWFVNYSAEQIEQRIAEWRVQVRLQVEQISIEMSKRTIKMCKYFICLSFAETYLLFIFHVACPEQLRIGHKLCVREHSLKQFRPSGRPVLRFAAVYERGQQGVCIRIVRKHCSFFSHGQISTAVLPDNMIGSNGQFILKITG